LFLFHCRWCQQLEEACIETVESQKMTKDLAICIHGLKKYSTILQFNQINFVDFSLKEDMYLNTKDFISAVKTTLDKKRSSIN